MSSGGFPFVLKLKNKKSLVYDLVSGVIDKLITKDILDLKKFSSETIAKIKEVVIEIGYGTKEYGLKQIENTAKKLDNFAYGIIVSERGRLELVNEKIIRIPLKFWLLI